MFSNPDRVDEYESQQITELYLDLEYKLLQISLKYTKNQATSEDVLHMAFENVIKHKSKILSLPCQKQRAYIVTIVKNLSLNVAKKNRRLQRKTEILADQYEEGAFVLADRTDIEAEYEQKQENLKLQGLIKQLSPSNSVVAEMHYIQDLDVDEIAEALGITASSVYKRLERARKTLKEKYEERGG